MPAPTALGFHTLERENLSLFQPSGIQISPKPLQISLTEAQMDQFSGYESPNEAQKGHFLTQEGIWTHFDTNFDPHSDPGRHLDPFGPTQIRV